jgi:glycosyltransferase involved in cell wall biosynthesis
MNHQTKPDNHISVCICTYKRPHLLSKLLSKLQDQVTDNLFTYSAVVVDNDSSQSARDAVADWQNKSVIQIDYFCETQQNIALARNKAVANARGNFIAFIDDDEFPDNTWLINLFKSILVYNCAGVLGPVNPHYPENTPAWLIESGICERPSHKTGAVLHWGQTRTGNVLLDRKLFNDSDSRFDREFGRTGGEDIEFFKKMISTGKIFIWCNEAPVYETVPPERWEKMFYLEKNLRIGGLAGEKSRNASINWFLLMKTATALTIYALALPVVLFFGEHLALRYLCKVAYNFSWLEGFLGHVFIRERP